MAIEYLKPALDGTTPSGSSREQIYRIEGNNVKYGGNKEFIILTTFQVEYFTARNESDWVIRTSVKMKNGNYSNKVWKGYYKIFDETVPVGSTNQKPPSTSGGSVSLDNGMFNNTIKHDSAGMKRLNLVFHLEHSKSTADFNVWILLPTTKDDKPSIISCNNFTDEVGPTIKYLVPKPEITPKVEFCLSLDNATEFIKYKQADGSKAENTYQFTFTEDEKITIQKELSHTNSKQVYVIMRSLMGDYTYQVSVLRTLTIVNAEPVIQPAVIADDSFTIGLTGSNTKLIRYKSWAKCSINASPRKYASIVKTRITNGGVDSNEAIHTYIPMDDGKFIFYAEDSRSYSTKQIVEANTVPYIKLTCNCDAYATLEPDNKTKLNLNVNGNYFNGSFGVKNNTIQVYYRYKKQNEEYNAWQALNPTFTEGKYSAKIEIPHIDVQGTLTVQGYAVDVFGRIDSVETVLVAMPVFDWSDTDFNFNVPVNFQKEITGKGIEPINTSIQTNADGIKAINDRLDLVNDYIIAEGRTNYWDWMKFNSGWAICYKRSYVNQIVFTLQRGQLYISNYIIGSRPYPFDFVGNPVFTMTCEATDLSYIIMSSRTPAGTNSNSPAQCLMSPVSYNGTPLRIELNSIAIGRWK